VFVGIKMRPMVKMVFERGELCAEMVLIYVLSQHAETATVSYTNARSKVSVSQPRRNVAHTLQSPSISTDRINESLNSTPCPRHSPIMHAGLCADALTYDSASNSIGEIGESEKRAPESSA
jgi:hypothetical protein